MFFIPISIKAAVTVGAIAGAAVAIVKNREFLLEMSAEALEYGARKCRQRLQESEKIYATSYSDGELFYDEKAANGEHFNDERSASEATTPDVSESEAETETETDAYSDGDYEYGRVYPDGEYDISDAESTTRHRA